jgi:hypothetical protein
VLSLWECKLRALQWFQQENDSWEEEDRIRGSFVLERFWGEFKGGRSAMRIGESRVASEENICKFFFQVVAVI